MSLSLNKNREREKYEEIYLQVQVYRNKFRLISNDLDFSIECAGYQFFC